MPVGELEEVLPNTCLYYYVFIKFFAAQHEDSCSMNVIHFVFAFVVLSAHSFAWSQQPWKEYELQDMKRQMELQRQETEQLRRDIQFNESLRESQRMLDEMKAKSGPSLMESIAQGMEERRLKKEAEAAEEAARHQAAVKAAQDRNQFLYLGLLVAVGIAVSVLRKQLRGTSMLGVDEKAGVLMMTTAAVLPFTSLVCHVAYWSDERDIVSNLFNVSVYVGGTSAYDSIIDFPLSWLIFSSVLLGAYGFLTFVDIVKPPAALAGWLKGNGSPTASDAGESTPD